MKFAWLRSTESGDAHLCVVTGTKRVVALCNHPFLTAVENATEENAKCDECMKVWNSGKAISVVDEKTGALVVVRPKIERYTGGTLDPFVDVAEMLGRMGVAYALVVGIPGQSNLRYWSNFVGFGERGLAMLRDQWPKILDAFEARFRELHDRENGD